jgi:hypothetical protein
VFFEVASVDGETVHMRMWEVMADGTELAPREYTAPTSREEHLEGALDIRKESPGVKKFAGRQWFCTSTGFSKPQMEGLNIWVWQAEELPTCFNGGVIRSEIVGDDIRSELFLVELRQ